MNILYRGHNGEHRAYYICQYCGSAFYDDTFTTTEGPNETPCPVCDDLVKECDVEEFNLYLRAKYSLTELISTEGCADRAPDRS